MNYINPTREQFKAIYGLPSDKPIFMLNLLQFRDLAEYRESDPEHADLSVAGRLAYERYSDEVAGVFAKAGGRQSWIGLPLATITGAQDENWSLSFIAYYPTVSSFVNMVKTEVYQNATRHRTAALLNSRLICCTDLLSGTSFAPASYVST